MEKMAESICGMDCCSECGRNQIEIPGSDRCYGLIADEQYLLVCDYKCNGTEPRIICYKKRGV